MKACGLAAFQAAATAVLILAGPLPCMAADDGAAEPGRFQASDISIGEPIALPVLAPPEPPAGVTAPAVPPAATRPPAGPIGRDGVSPAGPGSGWLGLVVSESAQPGRFSVAEVVAGGPAAAVGILAGDEVRAIDGMTLQTSDELAQALTAIAPGQRVRLAIARGQQVGDVTLEAVPRPSASRGWTAAAEPAAPTARAAAGPRPAAVEQPARAPAFVASGVDSGPQPPSFDPLPAPAGPATEGSRGRTALGVRTVPIDPGIQARFRLPEASGAYVIGVVGELPASRAGVPPGSVIVAIDNRPVRSPEELTRLVTGGPVGRPVPLEYVLPGGTPHRAEVVLQTLEQPLAEALVGAVEPRSTTVPSLQPRPAATTSRRPTDEPVAGLGDEVRRLRARVEALESRLGSGGRP